LQGEITEVAYDGIFGTDSFPMLRGEVKWYTYVSEVLYEVFKTTGLKCAAVVLPGASFTDGSYDRMLDVMKANLKPPGFVVWVSMANEMYPLSRSWMPTPTTVYKSIVRVIEKASGWVADQRVVYGGSSSTWRYDKHFHAAECSQYDMVCLFVVRCLIVLGGIKSANGDDVLQGVEIADNIGHVSSESMRIVSRAFAHWATWGYAPMRSRL
jgi:hypothetical protein